MKWLVLFLILGFLSACYPITAPQKPATVSFNVAWPWDADYEYVKDELCNTGIDKIWLSLQDANICHWPLDNPDWWAKYQ